MPSKQASHAGGALGIANVPLMRPYGALLAHFAMRGVGCQLGPWRAQALLTQRSHERPVLVWQLMHGALHARPGDSAVCVPVVRTGLARHAVGARAVRASRR